MFGLSTYLYAGIGVAVIAAGAYIWITLSHRAAEIARLTNSLTVANEETQKASDLANANAAKVREIIAADAKASAESQLKEKDIADVQVKEIGIVRFIATAPKSIACVSSPVIGGTLDRLYGAPSEAGDQGSPVVVPIRPRQPALLPKPTGQAGT